MAIAETLRYEPFDRQPDELLARVPKELLRLCVDEHEPPIPPNDQHRIGRGLEQTAEPLFGLPSLGAVANSARHDHPFLGLERPQTDLQPRAHRAHLRVLEVACPVLRVT